MKLKFKNKSVKFVLEVKFSKNFKKRIKKVLIAILKFFWDIFVKVIVGVIVKVLVDRLFYLSNRTFFIWRIKYENT